jgi:hypothetical protein
MVGFLWIVSNTNKVIRGNTSASLGKKKTLIKERSQERQIKIITYKSINHVIRNVHGKWST